MDKIVYRKGVPCKAVQQGWRVKVWESAGKVVPEGLKAPFGRAGGTGQRETLITPRIVFAAMQEERVTVATCDALGQDFQVDIDLENLEAKALESKRRAQARAKQSCRHKIKHAGLMSMLTGTYRENMKDFDRMRNDMARWLRIMRREIPGFRAVYAFEEQARGAWHFHCATDRLAPSYLRRGIRVKSFDLARRAWLTVVGVNNGNIDVDGHRSRRKQNADAKKNSLARLAAYVSKYLTKDRGDAALFGRNMWSSTQGLATERPIVLELESCSLVDAIEAAFEVPEGHVIALHRLLPFGRGWMLYTEPEA